jgi:hypothetical protein
MALLLERGDRGGDQLAAVVGPEGLPIEQGQPVRIGVPAEDDAGLPAAGDRRSGSGLLSSGTSA